MSIVKTLLATVTVAAGLGVVSAQQADNTKNNQGAANSPTTADKASNAKSDLQIMKQIRQAVVHDKSLSTDGHNVKIHSKGGKVTLSGPVKSDDEKKSIEQKAAEVAGADNVTSQLTVKSSS